MKGLMLGALGMLGGCVHQEVPADQWRQGETTELHMAIARAASADPEEAVTKLRLIAFRSRLSGQEGDGKLVFNSVSTDQSTFKEIVPTGYLDFYFIANEPTDLSTVTTVEQLEAAALTHTAAELASHPVPTALPMYGCYKEVKAATGGKLYVKGAEQYQFALERMLAKVSVKLNVKNSNFPAGTGKQVTVDRVQVKSLPAQSYWVSKPYTATGTLIASTQQTATAVTPPTGFNASWEQTFYVPEYILANADKKAYIEVTAHQVGDPTNTCTYLVPIGNAMDDAHRYGHRYDLIRNRHYSFTGNIKGYGNSDLELKLTVQDWSTVPVEGVTGEYVKFNRTLLDGVETTDYIMIESNCRLKVECETNTGSWWIRARLHDNSIYATNTPTSAVTTVTQQASELNITLPTSPPKIDVIEVCGRDLGGREIVIKRIFNDNSLIPSSLLELAGWPSDKLPPRGMQTATRGNGVLPGEIAEAEDLNMKWQTGTTAIGGTSENAGTGKSNTDRMIAANAGSLQHPAANYCRTMGPEWYLPSKAELFIIAALEYNGQVRLGNSYTFGAYRYWTSSEYAENYSSYFDFEFTALGFYFKESEYKVRCIRNI